MTKTARLLSERDILYLHCEKAKICQPAFFICADHACERIAVIIRGTNSFNDVLTDVIGTHVPYAGGFAHEGMLNSATWVLENAGAQLLTILPKYPTYGLYQILELQLQSSSETPHN